MDRQSAGGGQLSGAAEDPAQRARSLPGQPGDCLGDAVHRRAGEKARQGSGFLHYQMLEPGVLSETGQLFRGEAEPDALPAV